MADKSEPEACGPQPSVPEDPPTVDLPVQLIDPPTYVPSDSSPS